MSAINFTVLGLWWVAIKDRLDLRRSDRAGHFMAYLVSLQFVIPGTVSLLAQVAPEEPILWRGSFAVAGLLGAAGTFLLGRSLRRVLAEDTLANVLVRVAVPLYLLVSVVAAFEGVPEALDLQLASTQIEAFLLTLLVFLGVQAAWAVAMAPHDEPAATS